MHDRPHRTTGVAPIERFATEHGFLRSLPRRRFDTDYVEVPPGASGVAVHRVGTVSATRSHRTVSASSSRSASRSTANELTVRCGGRVVAIHRIVDRRPSRGVGPRTPRDGRSGGVGEQPAPSPPRRPRHRHRRRRSPVGRLELPGGDFDVAAPDLAARYDHGDPS